VRKEPADGMPLRLRLEPSPDFACLRDFLRNSEVTEPSICRRVGMAGLNEFLAGDRSRGILTGESDTLGVLIRLFLFGEALGVQVLKSVFPAKVLEAMEDLGLLTSYQPAASQPALASLPGGGAAEVAEGAEMCATVALYPVGKLFIVSDRWTRPDGPVGELPADFVFPALTPNTSQFITTLPHEPCESFLELCSGTGVAALEAARRGSRAAWAVDITERSTKAAEFNRLLNGLEQVTILQGNLYEGLGDLTFDRIAAHPPYMPALDRAQIYYDGGADGEQVTRAIVMGLPQHLRPGGCFYCLAQGSDREGAPFEQRARTWLGAAQSEFDVLVIARQEQSPADAAMGYAVKSKGGGGVAKRMREALAALRIQSMVYGWLIIQRSAEPRPVFTARRSASPKSRREEIEWLLRWQTAAERPEFVDRLAEAHPVAVPTLELHTVHRIKDGDLSPAEFSLHTEYPFAADCRVQPWVGFLLAQCDGKSSLRQLLEFCKAHKFVQPETPLVEFARLLMVLIAGGFLEVEGFELPGRGHR